MHRQSTSMPVALTSSRLGCYNCSRFDCYEFKNRGLDNRQYPNWPEIQFVSENLRSWDAALAARGKNVLTCCEAPLHHLHRTLCSYSREGGTPLLPCVVGRGRGCQGSGSCWRGCATARGGVAGPRGGPGPLAEGVDPAGDLLLTLMTLFGLVMARFTCGACPGR
jgi:hypothetical protein